jgi:hypothetical protein
VGEEACFRLRIGGQHGGISTQARLALRRTSQLRAVVGDLIISAVVSIAFARLRMQYPLGNIWRDCTPSRAKVPDRVHFHTILTFHLEDCCPVAEWAGHGSN